jgi:hypothetical protein
MECLVIRALVVEEWGPLVLTLLLLKAATAARV